MYLGTVAPLSLFYAVTKTPFVDIILHPFDYSGFDGPMGWMTRDMLSMSMGKFMYFVRLYKRWFDEQLTGSRYVTYGLLIVFLLLLEVKLLGKKPGQPVVPGKQPMMPDAKDPMKTRSAMQAHDAGTEQKKKHAAGFIWIILASELVYLVFCFLTCLPATRYVSFLFPFIPVLLYTGISRFSEGYKYRAFAIAGCAMLTFIGIVSGFLHSDRIEYVYMEDRPLIASLEREGIQDAIVIYTDKEDATHVVYDCVNLMPEEAKIYPVQEAYHNINTDESPDDLLIWIKNGESIHPCTDNLETGGYRIDWLGKTHASDVYVARRNN